MKTAWHLISTVKGKVKVIHSSQDVDTTKVFHGRYVKLTDAVKRANELNQKRGKR